jgi:hypothetical protein
MALGALYTTGSEPSLLLKVLRAAWWEKDLQGQDWKSIFDIKDADQAVEYELEMRAVSLGGLKAEGARARIASAGEGFKTAYQVNLYANTIYYTLESIQDNLYKSQWGPTSMGFAEAQDVLRNITVYSLFNDARNNNSIGSDGLPLLSLAHPTATRTFANTVSVPTQLNLALLQQYQTGIQLFTNYSDYPMQCNPARLITSVNNSQTAQALLFSPQDPSTANRSINPLFHGGYFKDGILTSPYLLDPNCSFAQSTASYGFTFYRRQDFLIQELPQSDALTYGFIGWERFARLYSTPRCVFGTTFFS